MHAHIHKHKNAPGDSLAAPSSCCDPPSSVGGMGTGTDPVTTGETAAAWAAWAAAEAEVRESSSPTAVVCVSVCVCVGGGGWRGGVWACSHAGASRRTAGQRRTKAAARARVVRVDGAAAKVRAVVGVGVVRREARGGGGALLRFFAVVVVVLEERTGGGAGRRREDALSHTQKPTIKKAPH